MKWTGAHTLQVLLPVLFGFLPEEPIPVEKRGLQIAKIRYM
jgi:hypothetical protein